MDYCKDCIYQQDMKLKFAKEFYTAIKNSNYLSAYYGQSRFQRVKEISLYGIRQTLQSEFNIEIDD